jgi:hypothetical protein
MNVIRVIVNEQELAAFLEAEEVEELADMQLVRQPLVRNRRATLIATVGDAEFKRQFRFTKEAFIVLSEMLGDQLYLPCERGQPVTVQQQLLVALNHYAGGHFQRTSAICGGISQPTVCRIIKRVSRAICEHKCYHLKMPSEQQLLNTAGNMNERFQLPRFGYAVDGMMARFDSKPRNLPRDPRRPLDPQDFFCRKGFYAINCQVYNRESLIIVISMTVAHSAKKVI